MTEVFSDIALKVTDFYREVFSFFPDYVGFFFNFLVLVLLVVVYSIFIWKFYKFISKENPLGLDLNKYNTAEHSFMARLLTAVFYFVEYILILPFLIFIVFFIFTFFLIILSSNQDTSQLLVISAVIIAAIRMTAYYKEAVSQEIAKMLPITLLGVSVLNPKSFSDIGFIERIISHITVIPALFDQIKYYLLFIIVLEVLLRFFDFLLSLFELNEEEIEEIKPQEPQIISE